MGEQFPKRPWRSGWQRLPSLRDRIELHRWWHARERLLVVSSAPVAEFRGELRPQWQVSASKVFVGGHERRPTDDEVAFVLREFRIVGAEEDNHMPGLARHFWMLCDLAPGDEMGCECKEGEETVVEPDGFKWQRTSRAEVTHG